MKILLNLAVLALAIILLFNFSDAGVSIKFLMAYVIIGIYIGFLYMMKLRRS
jgi:uncharacterized protein YqfA (UPF0365 family)